MSVPVAVRSLTVRIDGSEILADVDLDVAPGEWVGLIGPNGAGKTTLLGTVLGTVRPRAGRIEVSGRDAGHLDSVSRARTIASVPQRPILPAEMPVIDYVLLGRTPYIPYLGGETDEDVEIARAALTSLDLSDLAGRRLGTLSGGEAQRAVLARALAQAAPVLLLDEPTSALDVGHQQQVLDLVDGLRRERGLTIVSALHDLTLAAQFCDRLVMMAAGRVVAEGRAPSVLTESAIREHYGASVRVLEDGVGGVVVIPVRGSVTGPGTRTVSG